MSGNPFSHFLYAHSTQNLQTRVEDEEFPIRTFVVLWNIKQIPRDHRFNVVLIAGIVVPRCSRRRNDENVDGEFIGWEKYSRDWGESRLNNKTLTYTLSPSPSNSIFRRPLRVDQHKKRRVETAVSSIWVRHDPRIWINMFIPSILLHWVHQSLEAFCSFL